MNGIGVYSQVLKDGTSFSYKNEHYLSTTIRRIELNNRMGIQHSAPQFEKKVVYTLKQDRIIDFEPPIYIGICGKKQSEDAENPLSSQCIRLNHEPESYHDPSSIHSLKFYQQTKTSLCFEFESDIRLCLFKRPDGPAGEIMYNLKTPTQNITKKMDVMHSKMFKPLHLASNEFDIIHDFINKGRAVL